MIAEWGWREVNGVCVTILFVACVSYEGELILETFFKLYIQDFPTVLCVFIH